jgi:hypothetical protein
MNGIHRLRRVLLIGLLAGWCACTVAATPEHEEYERLVGRVADALWWGDFAELERLHGEWSQPGQQLITGWPKLSAFRSGVDRAMRGPREGVDLFYAELQAQTLAWAKANPRSGLAHALHASALVDHGWAIRGSGFARTVPPQAWADFERLVRQASEYLARTQGALSSTLSHSELLVIGRALGFNEQQVWAIVDDGLRVNPEDLVLYRQALTSRLPRWQGDNVAVERFIRRVVARTKETHGMWLYAWLYSAAAREEYEHRLFEDSAARWPEMAQGWRDLLARHPSQSTENRYAYFACLARDKAVLFELLDKIGDKPDLEEWGSNARRTFDTCRRWAQQQ